MTMHKPEQIRRRAYEIWQAEGCPPRGELRHWLIAESEFDEEHKPAGPFRGFSVLGERAGGNAGAVEAVPAAATDEVVITTGKEPARRKIKRTEGP
ncbi:hypothetical protein AKG11_30780 [Shinella sp. SUS2]|jgi:hypothetical protein|uniref:DUF2934 domain-containing protein n=1 Tax=unclassified Shinella TaxID=2643062 RepID=UPI0006A4855E|nr:MULTISPECIES: DUF2934 domain-containing protein [unclassified Shinella]KNY13163.1 hypothetical protein AKG11_30780 [Shinella sp. SUS2]KOC71945.1 hypothetical protein AKG10_30220 [Shinella sp. GWS1]TAA53192.1 DUF2934 domain-containing protein [Shinella sp. JR1-6]